MAATNCYGMRISDLEGPEDPEEISRHISQIRQTGSELFETLLRAKDGTVWPVEANVCYWQSLGGRIFCFARDITERKKLQIERDHSFAQLRLQIERMPLAYILMDADNRILDWNPAAEKIFGYTGDEVLGRECYDLIVPLPISAELQDVIRRVSTPGHACQQREREPDQGRPHPDLRVAEHPAFGRGW